MAERNLSRRNFLRVTALGGAGTILAACGVSPAAQLGVTPEPAAPTTAPDAGAAATTAPVEEAPAPTTASQSDVGAATGNNFSFLTISNDEEQKIFDQIATSFNGTNPGGNWTFDRLAGSWEDFSRKYTTELAAGAPHDAARIAIIQQPSYTSKGYVADLTAFAEKDGINFADYYDTSFAEWRVDGKLYGVPAGIYNMAVYYNKDMFDAAGIPHLTTNWDDAEWNWQTFQETAKKLTSGEGATKQYGFTTTWDMRWVIHFPWAAGGDFINPEHTKTIIAEPGGIEGLNFAQTLIREDQSWLTPTQLGNDNVSEAFQSGRVGMYLDGMWQMPALKNIESFKWGVAPVPTGKQRFTGIYVDAWVMPPGTKDPEQSWKFLKYMAGADAQNILVDNSALGLPILKSVVQDRAADLFKPLSPEEQQVWINAANYAHSFPFTAKWDELYDAFRPAWDLWGLGEIDAQTMAQQITEIVDPILAKA